MTRPEVYKFFADYVYQNSGITYKEHDYYRLDGRFNALIKHFNLKDVEELYALYVQRVTPEMHQVLINLCTNNETYFMRDLKPFKAFAKDGMEYLKSEFPNDISYNIWSAACSTGQEPYSLIMSIDAFGDASIIPKLRIEASDISSEALGRAKKGLYTGLEVQRGLPANLLIQNFTQEDEQWQLKDEIKRKVSFKSFNLLKDNFPQNQYHVIFCRNVLIYQDLDNKKAILEKIYKSLKVGGLLFMGAGESLIGVDLPMKQKRTW